MGDTVRKHPTLLHNVRLCLYGPTPGEPAYLRAKKIFKKKQNNNPSLWIQTRILLIASMCYSTRFSRPEPPGGHVAVPRVTSRRTGKSRGSGTADPKQKKQTKKVVPKMRVGTPSNLTCVI